MSTNTSKYEIVKEIWDDQDRDCEHPLCDTVHRRFRRYNKPCPVGKRVEWQIYDTTTGERVDLDVFFGPYSRKKDAVAAIAARIARLGDSA